MSISSIGSSPAATSTAENKPSVRAESVAEISRKQQNLAILEANRSVSLSAKNQPLSLVFQAAIDAINQQLAPELGEQAIQRTRDQGVDVSPEATAERIVSLTTGMFGRFQQHRPELSEPQQVDRFLELISSGIDQGFKEARDILDGLQVLEGDIATNIDRTYELVQKGLEAFRASFSLSDSSTLEPPATVSSEGSSA